MVGLVFALRLLDSQDSLLFRVGGHFRVSRPRGRDVVRQSVRELGERVERLEGELGRLNMENADLKSQLKERDARIALPQRQR